MNWASGLISLYDSNPDSVGKICCDADGKNPYTLFPLFHSSAMADIEVTLTGSGDFIKAAWIEKEKRFTVIPVTEESNCRTSGIAPHPLCDNLQYLAKNLGDYLKSPKKGLRQYHADYMRQLEGWASSGYSHNTVQAVYQYLAAGDLVADLIKAGVLTREDGGYLEDDAAKLFVRFLIRNEDEDIPCWLDKSLQEAYIGYYKNKEKPMVQDYLTGEMQRQCCLHPKKIRSDGDGAKLFSAGDKKYFTYRGRFSDREEAFEVGEDTSQKLHSALNWIIRKQGKAFGSMSIAVWESVMKCLPSWDAGTDELLDIEKADVLKDPVSPQIAKRFYSALYGYQNEIEPNSNVILIAVDAATPGRLSLV